MMRYKAAWLWLIFGWILLFAPHESLWYDETVNAYLATHSWDEIWRWTTQVDNQPPLHFVALKLWVNVAGDSEFALRLFSQGMAWLAAAGLFALAKRFGTNTYLATALFILSGSFIYAAGEVRTYAFSLALYVWSSVFCWALWQNPRKIHWSKLIGYWLLTISLVYSHYTAWFGISVQWSLILARFWQTRPRPYILAALSMGTVLLSVVPWLLVLQGRDFNAGTAFEGHVSPRQALETYLNFYYFGQKIFDAAATNLSTRLALLMFTIGLFPMLKWRKINPLRRAQLIFVAMMLLFPLAVMLYSVQGIEAKLSGRHLWLAWPAVGLWVSGGIQAFPRQWQRGGIVAVLLFGMGFIYQHKPTLTEEYTGDFRKAFAILRQHAKPDDLLVLQDGTLFTAAEYYQSPLPYIGIPDEQLTNVYKQIGVYEAWDLISQRLSPQTEHIWVLAWQGATMDPTGLALAIPEYLSNGQRQIWLNGDGQREVFLAQYPLNNAPNTPLPDHIAQYQGVLQVHPEGPSLLGFDVFRNQQGNDCGVMVHTWWWRGQIDYPATMMGIRVADTNNTPLVQHDMPPAGYVYGQAKWPIFTFILGRADLRLACDQLMPDTEYIVALAVYDAQGEKPTQPVELARFTFTN